MRGAWLPRARLVWSSVSGEQRASDSCRQLLIISRQWCRQGFASAQLLQQARKEAGTAPSGALQLCSSSLRPRDLLVGRGTCVSSALHTSSSSTTAEPGLDDGVTERRLSSQHASSSSTDKPSWRRMSGAFKPRSDFQPRQPIRREPKQQRSFASARQSPQESVDDDFDWDGDAEPQGFPKEPSMPSEQDAIPQDWLTMYDRLKAYREEYGDCLIPRAFWEDVELGEWVVLQREAARAIKPLHKGAIKGTPPRGSGVSPMTQQRAALLDELGFAWKVSTDQMLWATQLHEMRRYRAIHGSAYVPPKWEDPTGDFNNHLAKWVHQQPTLFAQRRLTLEQVRSLVRAGLDVRRIMQDDISQADYATAHAELHVADARNEFELMYEELAAWKASYRTCMVPRQVWDNPVLGAWVHRLRRDYKKQLLPQWQVDRLDALDFAWSVDVHSAKWHHALHEARRYKDVHGTGVLPAGYRNNKEPGWTEAGRWLAKQAGLFNKGKLNPLRTAIVQETLDIRFAREPEWDAKKPRRSHR